ncbi:MAG: DUF4369 domain-containing protein [Cryomorphaceae bacterium]|jgi:hypothetical protein|nr:MAG: DUF4369 domain-containing protein [Cryomorphaceae bacterium]|tara:strand:- start:2597 stop:3271 length:675 start_codon:yes stop_codon:yes gene_type:complete
MKLYYILFLLFIIGCVDESQKSTINLDVKGLKKGTLVLKKLSDSSFVKLDSFIVNSGDKINFSVLLDQPEMLFIDLKLNEGSDIKTLNFFAEKSKMDIVTNLENFGYELVVKGSKNDSIYRNYISLNKKFNDQKLDLFKRSFEKSKSNDLDSLKIIEDLVVNINKRQFLHNANFAVRNSEFELSPYIALTDLYESKKILDTVYKSLSARIKNSKYAKQLKSIID